MKTNTQYLKVDIKAVAAMMITAICVGVVYMWSAYKAAAEAYYSWTPASANMVSSIMLFAFTGGSFIGGAIQDRMGPKRTSILGTAVFSTGMFLSSALPSTSPIGLFYLTYSAIGGLGTGFVFSCTLSGVPKWFPGRTGLGTGLAASAFAASTVVFSPVCSALLEHFTMPVTLRIFAAATFVISMAACMFIKIPSAEEYRAALPPQKGTERKNYPLTAAMRMPSFWLLFLCLFFYNGTWNMVTPLIRGLGVERGLAPTIAVLVLSMTGVGNALGRFVMSSLSDKVGRYNAMYILCSITAASSLGLTVLGGGGYVAAVLAAAFAYGGPAAVYPALTTDLWGPRHSGSNYGFLMLGLGLSSIVFNAISNGLFAASGSYTPSFVMGAVTAVITAVLITLIRRRTGRK